MSLVQQKTQTIVYNRNQRLNPYKKLLIDYAKTNPDKAVLPENDDFVELNFNAVTGNPVIDLTVSQLGKVYEVIVFDFESEI